MKGETKLTQKLLFKTIVALINTLVSKKNKEQKNPKLLNIRVLVSWGCCKTGPQTGWLKQQEFVLSQF